MHEASVAKDVMEIIMETIETDADMRNKPINKITFSQSFPPTVVPDSFEFYFVELVKGSVLEGAELVFKECKKHGFFIDSINVVD